MRLATSARVQHTVCLLAYLALAAVAAWTAPRLFVLFDEAYNLNVSVNLARHGLYATQISGAFVLFDPQVSTGPVLLAPLALALRLGGTTLAAARLAMLVIFLLCLFATGWGAHELLRSSTAALLFVIVFAMAPLVLEFGLCAMGEVPATALAVAGFGLSQRAARGDPPPLRWLLLSGLAFGLAILCKDIMALALPALVLTWLAQAAAQRSLRHGWRWLVPALTAAACTLAWHMAQLAVVRWTLSPDAAAAWYNDAAAAGSLLWRSVAFAPFSHLAAAWQISAEYYLPLLVALALAAFATRALRHQRAPATFAWLAVGVTCLVWVIWYYFMSGPTAMHRHLLPGLALGLLLVVQALWTLAAAPGRSARLLAVALACCLGWSVLHGVGYLRLYLASSEPRLALQQHAARWIAGNTAPGAVLYGWGWYAPWHIAFLADRAVARIDPASLPGAGQPGDLFVLSPELAWSGSHDTRVRAFLDSLGAPALDQRLYPVYRMPVRDR